MNLRALSWIAVLASACSSSRTEPPASTSPAPATAEASVDSPVDPNADHGVAYFAGGCFWGVEYYLEQMDGVLDVRSGYMGGHVDEPTYAEVSSQRSGHLETVEVRFDPSRVTYEAVAQRFFEIHDPTQANGQGPDIGPEYLSAVFYADESQKRSAEGLIAKLEQRGYDVATQVRPAQTFWPAETYHQDYYSTKDKTPYCHTRVRRFDD